MPYYLAIQNIVRTFANNKEERRKENWSERETVHNRAGTDCSLCQSNGTSSTDGYSCFLGKTR